MKQFFSITENKYTFEWWDLTTILTVLNVSLIILGFWWSPILGIVNSGICTILNIKNKAHINTYITQIALVILNIYFLKL